jgi:DNA-directed RNA polymerase specialized sigma24 family protein
MVKKKNYVNNAEFYQAMVEYKKACREAEDAGDEPPRIPNYIGTCLYEIANRLSYKPNFINYSYRDDMVADGLENAVIAINNFDPDKSMNPFAYFTQIIYFAFIRRIQKEKKQLYVKHKVVENSVVMGVANEASSTGEKGSTDYIDLNNDYMNDFVTNFEESLEKKKREKIKKKQGLENFYEDD